MSGEKTLFDAVRISSALEPKELQFNGSKAIVFTTHENGWNKDQVFLNNLTQLLQQKINLATSVGMNEAVKNIRLVLMQA